MNKLNLLQCINLYKSYKDGNINHCIIKKISFILKTGEMSAIIGKSGSGKSTFLHLLGGLDNPSSGKIFFNGQSLSKMSANEKAKMRNRNLGFIYQFHHLLLDFTVLENVAMPLLINKKSYNITEKAYNILKIMNLEKKIKKYPSELSGGEKQRVAIARALINNPSLVIADEPTGNLDEYNRDKILNIIFQLNKDHNTAFLIVTHDLDLAKKMPNVFVMKHGVLSKF